MLKLFGDYHTHSNYSDGTGSLRANAEAARAVGLHEVAFTEHGYNNPTIFALSRRKMRKQRTELEKLRPSFPDLVLLQGIEADIIGLEGDLDLDIEEMKEFDILIAGFHPMARPKSLRDVSKYYYYAHRNMLCDKYMPPAHVIKRNTESYIKAIQKYPIDIIPHINNHVKVDVVEVAKACADYGTIIEINCKHIDIAIKDMEEVLKTGVRLMANTDAHKPDRIGNFSRIETFLNSCGLSDEILANKYRRPKFRSKS